MKTSRIVNVKYIMYNTSLIVIIMLFFCCNYQQKGHQLEVLSDQSNISGNIAFNNTDSVDEKNNTKALEDFIETTESAPVTVTELIAGIKFGMSRMQYNAHYDQFEKLECDHFKIIINGISFFATDGEQSFFEDELYDLNLYLNYKDLDGKELAKADFDSLAIYFKSVYGDDSLHYTYTENPVSEFPTHHWRKNNLYFQLSWLPEDEISNTISLEYRNSPVYRKVMKAL